MHPRLVILFYLLFPTHAGDYFCQNGVTIVDEISSESGLFYHRVIPQLDMNYSTKGLTCNWDFYFKLNQDSVIVISGFNIGKADLSLKRYIRSAEGQAGTRIPTMKYYLGPPFDGDACNPVESRKWESIELETFRIMPLKKRSHLSITFQIVEGDEYDPRTPGLAMQVMIQGQCSSEIVNFNRNCYTSIQAKRSLEKELAVLNNGSRFAQLASFSSASELQNFVEQSQKKTVGAGLDTRSQLLMNLTHPLRIGLFFDNNPKKIYYLSKTESVCKIKEFPDAERLLHTVRPSSNNTVTCGSVRIRHSAHVSVPVVEFGDCNEPLPTMISFRDTANKDQCINCSHDLLSWLKLTSSSKSLQKKVQDTDPTQQVNNIPILLIVLIVLISLGLALLFFIAICILKRTKNCQDARRTDIGNELPLASTTANASTTSASITYDENSSNQCGARASGVVEVNSGHLVVHKPLMDQRMPLLN